MKNRNLIVSILAGTLVIGLVGLIAITSAAERSATTVRAPQQVTGLQGSLPSWDGAGTDPAAGVEKVPTADVVTIDGKDAQVGDGPQLLVFLAHWCPVCDDELGTLARLPEDAIPDDVELLAILSAEDSIAPNWPAEQWFAGRVSGIDAARDSEDSTLLDAYGLTAFPAWVAVSADGTLVARSYGLVGADGIAALARAARDS